MLGGTGLLAAGLKSPDLGNSGTFKGNIGVNDIEVLWNYQRLHNGSMVAGNSWVAVKNLN